MASLRTALLALSPREWIDSARNLLLWRRVGADPETLALWNLHFDADRYRAMHPDVAAAGVDPRIHFLLRGNREFRDPSAGFSTRNYLASYPEVATGRVNALLHFVLFGKREGREAGGQAFALFSPTRHRRGQRAALSINNEWRTDYPLVSVIIPCFNYGECVEEAIQSILRQTFSNFEIIVVEGGSTDPASIDQVRKLEARGIEKTHFYFREERHLAGDNRNFGISRARGRYIVCLDADDTLRPLYLELAVFMAEVFGYDIVSPSVACHGDSDEIWRMPDPHFEGILKENQISTAALFRRGAWAHIGGYRDWGLGLEHVPEDWDFWIRMIGHGYCGTALRDPLLDYRVHGNSLSNATRFALLQQREALKNVNPVLWNSAPATNDPRFVVNPWVNLAPEADARPGFLLALPHITIGGAEKLFRTLMQGLENRGWRVVVITTGLLSESMPDDAGSFKKITPHVYQLASAFTEDEVRYGFLRYLIHRYAVRTMMLAGCQFVYGLLENLRREFPEMTVVDQLFNDIGHVENNRLHALSIDATLVPSEQLRESLIRMGVEASRIHTIPHGIELPEAAGALPDDLPESARGKIIVGFFGRLSIEKGPDLFIEIVRKLAARPELFFIMTGAGPETQNVEELIRKYQLEDRIYAPGFVEDVAPLMRAADIMVLPSRIDGMPLAVLEAQALGKPVVASRIGSLPAMIEHERTGFLCDAGDLDGFAQRIVELAADEPLRERMKAAAQASVREKYGAERMIEEYERVFRNSNTAALKAMPAVGNVR